MYFSNYRPISLLSTFSKIVERLPYNRILDFLNKHKTLNKYQFGFRTNHSTYMALINLVENLMKALENCENAIGTFLDFQKAFDTVNHIILLDKLCIYGIRGPALAWITSYNMLSIKTMNLSVNTSGVVYHTVLSYARFCFYYISTTCQLCPNCLCPYYLLTTRTCSAQAIM